MNDEDRIVRVLQVPEESEEIRSDVFAASSCPDLTRSQLAQRSTELYLSGKRIKPSRKLHPGDTLTIIFDPPRETGLVPEEIPLDVMYEDARVIVVNKEAGVVVHPGAGNISGTLLQGVLHRCTRLLNDFPEGQLRPGVVHRLDKDTSGTIIMAKDPESHEFLARQFHDRLTRKVYIAVLRGVPQSPGGTIITRIARDRIHRKEFRVIPSESSRGKNAETRYRILKAYGQYCLASLEPVTGRTHQLRVHMRHIGCPIVGDAVYGRASELGVVPGLLLHAFSLEISIPEGGRKKFRSRLPSRFREFIEILNA